MSAPGPVRVAVRAGDAARRRELTALVRAAGHALAEDGIAADVVLADADMPAMQDARLPEVLLGETAEGAQPPPALLPAAPTLRQLDAALRAVAAGLTVRTPPRSRRFEAEPPVRPPLLTPRELEILVALGEGLSNKAVARRLGISQHTVKFHLEAVFAKLVVGSRAEAVAKGLRQGLIEL